MRTKAMCDSTEKFLGELENNDNIVDDMYDTLLTIHNRIYAWNHSKRKSQSTAFLVDILNRTLKDFESQEGKSCG